MVGPQIAGVTEAERVHDGVLHVATKSAPWASELNFHKADILRRLNERVGARAGKPLISDIRFYNRGNTTKKPILETAPSLYPTRAELEDIELSASDKAQIEADVAVVTDEKLRDRLRRARMAGLRLQTWRMENGWCPCDICGELAPPRFPYDGTLDCLSCRMKRVASRRPTEGRI
jgi:predicted nucleic acid-binding Zn ribbon protein